MSITLEHGRLCLRRPELGGFLMVEVEYADDAGLLATCSDGTHHEQHTLLPVLRSGDLVPAGSLLLDVNTGKHLTMWETNADMEPVDMQAALYEATMFALLRYGPEEDA